jgi:hypothetical protein
MVDFKAELSSERFRQELHHLLWIDPLINKGVLDEGWNCRDHTLVVAGLAAIRNHSVDAISGAAGFVQGPMGDERPVGRDTGRHWWLRIDGIGTCDLSPRLVKTPQLPEWADWQDAFLLGGAFVPAGTINYGMTPHEPVFRALFNDASSKEGQRSAFYLRKAVEPLGLAQFDHARVWVNSPLTDRLKKRFPMRKDIYLRAVLHLDDFIKGAAASMCGLTPTQAWTEVAARPGNACVEFRNRLAGSQAAKCL